MSTASPAPIGAQIIDGLVASLILPHPDGFPLDACYPPDSGVVAIPVGATVTPGMTYANGKFGPAPTPPAPPLPDLAARLVVAAQNACDALTAQVIPDETHKQAYLNAATIAWANGGKAPAVDPAKSIFAAQGASVGIGDPDTFAGVVIGVSLGSLQLATLFGALKAAVDQAKSVKALATALTTFEAALTAFVTQLNAAGLTTTVVRPDPIVIVGINA